MRKQILSNFSQGSQTMLRVVDKLIDNPEHGVIAS